MNPTIDIRDADPADIAPLSRLWHDGWHRAHAAHAPAALVRLRTVAAMERRLLDLGKTLRVAGPQGQPLGLCITRDDELYQICVSQAAEGLGVARALLTDGELQIARAGHQTAWLICLPENTRARRFYSNAGWRHIGQRTSQLESPQGSFSVTTALFEKALS